MSFHPYKQGPSTLTGGLLESETEPHELDAKFVTAVLVSGMLGFLSTFTELDFLCIQLPLRELSPSWASAVLGLCLVWVKPRLFQPG